MNRITFNKKGNEDQYRFNLKVGDAMKGLEAKEACSSHQFEKVHASLEQSEKHLSERKKHILLADKSDFGMICWMIPTMGKRLFEQKPEQVTKPKSKLGLLLQVEEHRTRHQIGMN